MSMLYLYYIVLVSLIFYMVNYCFFFCKQKTAYEMRISDWSSDVCSSDLILTFPELYAQDIPVFQHLFSLGVLGGFKIGLIESFSFLLEFKIGRASCRERVCQYV